MTDSEWTAVRAHLIGSFPGLVGYFERIPADVRETTRQQWRRVLDHCDPTAVMRAIDSLVDESEQKPQSYERYPAAIAAIARKRTCRASSRASYVGGQQTFTCLDCLDMGMVVVVTGEGVTEIEAAHDEGREVNRLLVQRETVRCPCGASHGTRLLQDTYDKLRHYRIDGPTWTEEFYAGVLSWLGDRRQKVAKFVNEFQEFADDGAMPSQEPEQPASDCIPF